MNEYAVYGMLSTGLDYYLQSGLLRNQVAQLLFKSTFLFTLHALIHYSALI